MHLKLKGCCLLFIGFILFLIVSVLYQPLRNRVFHFLLPGAWSQLSTRRIIELYYDVEPHYPVGSTPVSCNDIEETIKMGKWEKFETEMEDFPVYDDNYFQMLKSNLTSYGIALPEFERIERHYRFKPTLTAQMQKELYLTFKVLVHALELFNVTYFLKGGAMIGAYRHHGMIPWDDDLDICLKSSDWLKVEQILSCIPGFDVYAGGDLMYKFFYKKSPLWQEEKFIRFPFIDLYFLREDNDYFWHKYTYTIFFNKSELFPLKLLPFGDMLVAVPNNVGAYINEFHDAEKTCSSNYFNHITRYFDYFYKYIPCSWLYGVYPFVKRKRTVINGKQAVVESRMLGTKELNRFIVYD